MISLSTRPPRTMRSALTHTDLPAPVSPVRTPKPASRPSDAPATTATSLTRSSRSVMQHARLIEATVRRITAPVQFLVRHTKTKLLAQTLVKRRRVREAHHRKIRPGTHQHLAVVGEIAKRGAIGGHEDVAALERDAHPDRVGNHDGSAD